MTKKERILAVFRGEIPDQVPVSAGISEMIPVRLSGKSYTEVFHFEPIPLWKLRVDAERYFDTDAFIHTNPTLLPQAMDVEKVILQEEKDCVIWEEIFHTKNGDLRKKIKIHHLHGFSILEPLVKTVDDLRIATGLYKNPSDYSFDSYLEAYKYLGDDGSIAMYFRSPFDLMSDLFGGAQNCIYSHYDEPIALEEFTEYYTNYVVSMLEEIVYRKIPSDVIQLGAANLSQSVTSPEFFDCYMADFLKKVLAVEEKYPEQLILQQHTCGKSRNVLTQAVDIGLKAFEPIEEPPMGDVELKEVKQKYGDRIVLKGNINAIETMLNGTPEKVRREVKEKLEIGMPGGRFFLAVGDQSPYNTPYENIYSLVESVHEFGVY